MITTRQYLRFYSKDKDCRIKLRKLFNTALENGSITEQEYWVLIYAYAERRMVENTCAKLYIQKTKYHSILNQALIKIEHIINNLDKLRTF